MKFLQLLLSLGLTISLLYGCGGAEERKAAYMEKAQQSVEAGDLEKARIELKNVLQIDPKHAEGYYMLGEVFEKQQDFRKAFANYNKAAELDPEDPKYQAKIGQFHLVLANDIEVAREKVKFILEKDPDNTHGLLLKAGVLLRENKPDEAIEISERIFTREPGNVDNAILLATLHNKNRDFQAAADVLKQALEQHERSMPLLQTLATVYFNAEKYDQAEKILKQKLSLEPAAYSNYIDLARFYILTEKPDKAKSVLQDAITADPSNPERMTAFIKHIREKEGNQAAIESTLSLIDTYPEAGVLRLALAQLYFQENDLEAVKKTFQSAIEEFPDEETGITARIGIANLYLAQNEIEKAKEYIEEALSIAPNDANVNMANAKLAFAENNAEEAIISLRKVVKDAPSNLEAYFMLARAHGSLGENEQANETIVRAYENNRDNADNLLMLAKYHLANRDMDQSEQIIDDYLSLNENNLEALTIKAGILNDSQEYKDAKIIAEQIIDQFPEKPNGYMQYAKASVGLNEVQSAENMLIQGYEKTGMNLSVLEMLSNLQTALKKYDEAINRLDMKLKEEQTSVLHAMKGKILLAAGRMEEGEQSLLAAKEYDNTPPQVYQLLSKLYTSQNEKDKLLSILREGVERYPSNVSIALTLASLYEHDGNYDAAIQLYEDLLGSGAGSNNAIVVNNLAALLSDHRDDAASNQRALELVKALESIDQPMLQDTVGWVYFKNDKLDKAIAALTRAVEKSPDNAIFNYHLGMAYYESGEHEASKKHLSIAVNSEQEFAGKEKAREILQKI